jgi:hypothetical protein
MCGVGESGNNNRDVATWQLPRRRYLWGTDWVLVASKYFFKIKILTNLVVGGESKS